MSAHLTQATVVGAGAMGTLCAHLLAAGGARVRLWGRSREFVASVQRERENRRYLPGLTLADAIEVTHDFAYALADTQAIVSAVPCQHVRAVWSDCREPVRAPMVSVAKGIEVGTLLRPTQILTDTLGDVQVAALSGPCLAPEVAAGLPTAVVAAGSSLDLATQVQQAFASPTFRVYTNTDLTGVELGGAVKNVIGIAAGIGDGLQMGLNAKAGLLTRGIVEITRLGVALGAHADTFKGLAGIGDLICTCNSDISRNHTAGVMIGRGATLAQVVDRSRGIVEGIESTRSILQLADERRVEMPITRAVYTVLFEGRSPQSAIEDLMTRQLRSE